MRAHFGASDLLVFMHRMANNISQLQSAQPHDTQHNRQVWVNRFPLEILCAIFRFAHHRSAPDEKALLTLRLTWVCQNWRTSATGDAGLWSVITIPQHEHILRFIDLSKESRLTVTLLDLRTLDVVRNILPPVMRCIARIVHLTLHWTLEEPRSQPTERQLLQLSDFVTPDALEILPNRFPKLITVDLRNISLLNMKLRLRSPKRKLHLYRCSFIVESLLQSSSTLTDICITDPFTSIGYQDILTLLEGSPLLRQLDLSDALALQPHAFLSAERISLPALQTFYLNESDFSGLDSSSTLTDICITDPFTSIGYQDILTLLEGSPLLRQLDLSDALALQPHAFLSAERISLPALQTFYLNESDFSGLDVATRFLNRLDLPRIRNVRLWTNYASNEQISSLLLSAHHACRDFPITYISLLVNSEGWSQVSIADEQAQRNPHITLRIDPGTIRNPVSAVLDHLPMNQLEYFRIATYESGSYAQNWIPILVQSQVSTLFLQDDSIEDFSASLDLIVSGSFPCLTMLGFSHTPDYHPSGTGAAELPIKVIEACVHHTPLYNLVFYGDSWDSSEESVQLLGEMGCKFRFEADDTGYMTTNGARYDGISHRKTLVTSYLPSLVAPNAGQREISFRTIGVVDLKRAGMKKWPRRHFVPTSESYGIHHLSIRKLHWASFLASLYKRFMDSLQTLGGTRALPQEFINYVLVYTIPNGAKMNLMGARNVVKMNLMGVEWTNIKYSMQWVGAHGRVVSSNSALISSNSALVSSNSALVSSNSALVSSNSALVSSNSVFVSSSVALISSSVALISSSVALISSSVALVSSSVALVSSSVVLVSSSVALVSSSVVLVSSSVALVSSSVVLVSSSVALVSSSTLCFSALCIDTPLSSFGTPVSGDSSILRLLQVLYLTVRRSSVDGTKFLHKNVICICEGLSIGRGRASICCITVRMKMGIVRDASGTYSLQIHPWQHLS
ncbi:hypothetical protein BDN72DRAFT_865175 [Pluteus cervinus]|uniref:Uncharacterized protein n=1 Tax=Pluteus cervinus TaxID=181527 RepID=A0ACD3A3H7_9AGAR|nr:hypothetical protein BDN72DRAFT_865175 [Pluteus cervinus]